MFVDATVDDTPGDVIDDEIGPIICIVLAADESIPELPVPA